MLQPARLDCAVLVSQQLQTLTRRRWVFSNMQFCAIFIDVVQIIANICNQTLVNEFNHCPDQMWAHWYNRPSFVVVLTIT